MSKSKQADRSLHMVVGHRENAFWSFWKILILLFGLIIILGPMYLVVANSFKTLDEASQNFFALPKHFSLDNIKELVTSQNYFMYVGNSFYVSVVSMVLVTIFVPMVSYALARNLNRRYYNFLYHYVMLGLFIPSQVIMLPIVKQMSSLNLMNHVGLILLYVTFSLTRGVFLFVNYIRALPVEVEEAARIDGCNVLQTYFKVVIHLIRPMIATLVIMDFLWYWNDFQLPLFILNKSRSLWTLPLFQYNFKTEYSFDYPMAFTAYLVALIPVLVVYCACQKHIINGLTAGAVKS